MRFPKQAFLAASVVSALGLTACDSDSEHKPEGIQGESNVETNPPPPPAEPPDADPLPGAIDNALDGAGETVDNLRDQAEDAVAGVQAQATELIEGVKEKLGAGELDEAGTMLERLQGLKDQLPEPIQEQIDSLVGQLDAAKEAASNLGGVGEALGNLGGE